MSDHDKMRALAKALRDDLTIWTAGLAPDWETSAKPAADAIDLLLAEVEQNRIDQLEAQGTFEEMDLENNRLRAELEAAAADKRDAERYRWMAERFLGVDFEWGRCEDGYGGVPAIAIQIPEDAKVWGCLDLTVDYQLGRAPASEGEQK